MLNLHIFNMCERYMFFVERMPDYNGGEVAFMNDFSKKLQYTFSESEEIKTRLQVQFVIDVKGHLTGARICNKTDNHVMNEVEIEHDIIE